MRTQLLLIDPQYDFCDLPGAALPVAGANADLQRVAQLIARLGDRLDAIHVTLDTHQPLDIAHPVWWRDAAGNAPAPFTVITANEVHAGIWQARDPAQRAASMAYVDALATSGKYQLVIWPEHCLAGSPGHAVQPDVLAALHNWSRSQLKTVNFVSKGMNPRTEHYSAIQAEVPDPQDATTRPDAGWLAQLAQADTLLIAGEALSHCVASTVRDLAAQLPDRIERFVLLTDCSSPVPGFEALGEAFVTELTAQGMRLSSTANF
ncbi:hypothetical protein [Chitinilyticum piscinae]|uniref:Nicotinamidase-related amidase n=1 Tax=Chitinilyticum piscinae TaxID=2866724 RepID=A0A8J7FIY2_9NEIS|nr:hypothetical protein [Chitinilyticum piscinae]MBE9608307.1 hypothetical protein [Chitinilyticum piscinae]